MVDTKAAKTQNATLFWALGNINQALFGLFSSPVSGAWFKVVVSCERLPRRPRQGRRQTGRGKFHSLAQNSCLVKPAGRLSVAGTAGTSGAGRRTQRWPPALCGGLLRGRGGASSEAFRCKSRERGEENLPSRPFFSPSSTKVARNYPLNRRWFPIRWHFQIFSAKLSRN